MIRKINKIIALILIAAGVSTVAPIGIGSVNAEAAVNDNSEININSSTNNVTLAGPDISSMIPDGNTLIATAESTVINPQLENGVESVFKLHGATGSITNSECGKLSYTLSDTMVSSISTQVLTALKDPLTNAIVAKAKQATGGLISDDKLKAAIEPTVEKNLNDALPSAIKSRFEDIPLYQYTGKDSSGNVKEQAFVVKGLVGSIVNSVITGGYIVDTYNADVKNRTYNSLAPVPALAFDPLTSTGIYGKEINLSNSAEVIGDGMSINVVDSINNKVYVINNPIYNMLKAQQNASNYINKDLNIIDFTGVSNLKGSLSSSLDMDGTKFSILSLTLTADDVAGKTNKIYAYNLIVGQFEKALLAKKVETLNLPSATNTAINDMMKLNTYVMIPDIKAEAGNVVDDVIDKSGVGKAIDHVTDGLDDVSDAVDDLTDALKDKNDDVDHAWDKVFDRFDNEPGWGKKDGYIYYYDKDGVSLKGVQKIKGKTYYFNRIDGAMETGWQIVDGKRCYFDKKKGYEVYNKWVQDGDDWYFVGEDGAAKKMAWVNDGGKSYYLKADGKMTRDWLKIDDYWYCFNKNGSMVTSTWKWYDGKWYYLKDNGQATTNWTQIGDKWYCFKDPSGEMQTGWFRADGNWYCANDDGSMKTGWASSKDGLYYLDDSTGKMKKNEWVTVDGKTYYFNINGTMATGSKYIDGTKYVFNSDGTLSE